MRSEILLLRHGQSEGNERRIFGGHSQTPLTALGREQARATAAALMADGGVSAIFCSDLQRAIETAQPISDASGIPMVIRPELRERSVGRLTGLTFAEAEAQYPEVYAGIMRSDPMIRPPDGETHAECAARAIAAFDLIAKGVAHGRTLVVSHALTLHLLLEYLLGIRSTGFFQTDNCGLHRLRPPMQAEEKWTAIALNDCAHIAKR